VTDASPGPGWWLASDGNWYPPNDRSAAPAPGWWLAADGNWYPPDDRSAAPGPGWWLAADGNWYPPEDRPAPDPTDRSTRPTSKPAKPRGRAKRAKRGRGEPPAPAADTPLGPAPKPKWAQQQPPPQAVEPPGPLPSPLATPTPPTPTPAPVVEPTPAPVAMPPPAPVGEDAPVVTSVANPLLDGAGPGVTEAISPDEQIARRNRASKADAMVLASQRAAAASRALDRLRAELAATPPAGAAPRVLDATPPAPRPGPGADQLSDTLFAESVPTTTAPLAEDGPPPLLEVKSSPLGSDLEHFGDRLAIYVDRVELRDRLDRVRQSIAADDIVEVVVQGRLTGAVLTVESRRGPGITAKGLRPDQAEAARELIERKTRPVRLDDAADAVDAVETADAVTGTPVIDEAAMVSKLDDLHRAGVLTDEEHREKVELVGRLARGGDLTPSSN
jgi:hypothetical protein